MDHNRATSPARSCKAGVRRSVGSQAKDLWRLLDEDLIALATHEIARIGLVAATDVVDACVVRQPKAYPVYDNCYRATECISTIIKIMQ